MKGFDTGADCTSHGRQILDGGYGWVGRYTYSIVSHAKTKLTRAEALHLSGMGIYLVNVFQNSADHAGYFFSFQGVKDGTNASDYAKNTIKQPTGTSIYFAVDYDASWQDMESHILPYFHGLKAAMEPAGYHVGVYGSGFICRRLKEEQLVNFTWRAQSLGWAESREHRDYNIVQHDTISWHGLSIDPNDSNGNGGGWQVK